MNRYSKIMLAASLSFTVGSSLAAQSVSVFNNHEQLNRFNQLIKKQAGAETSKQIAAILASSSSGQFKLLNKSKQAEEQFLRYQQTYQGIPIWDHQVVIVQGKDNKVLQGYGNMINNIAADIPSIPKISASEQKAQLKHFIKSEFSQKPRVIRDRSVETVIYVDDNQQAHLAHKLSFFTDVKQGKSNPQRIVAFIDVFNKSIIAQQDLLKHYHDHSHNKYQYKLADPDYPGASGPSGNDKVVRPDYTPAGHDDAVPKTFTVKREFEADGSKNCIFDAKDVKTIDHNHDVIPVTDSYSYDCTNSIYHDDGGYKGARSALNDAHYHGQLTSKMFEAYLSQQPFSTESVVQKVHYGRNMDQAFYDNGEVAYGDGEWIFHPMVALDVVAHEIAHGYTAGWGTYSNKQMHTGQAGAINESFSDIAGAAAEYFLGKSLDVDYVDDWMSNHESLLNNGALRYFADPTLDGVSIAHTRDYEASMLIHWAAGIFNRAFHRLVTMPISDTEQSPWNTQYGFILFASANKNCWYSNTTFAPAADCIKRQASKIRNQLISDGVKKANGSNWSTGELKNHVRKAFEFVGVDIKINQGVESDFVYTNRFLDFNFTSTARYVGANITNVNDWDWAWDFGDGSDISTQVNPSHSYVLPGKYLVTLTITNKYSGKTDFLTIEVNAQSGYCEVSGSTLENYYLSSVSLNGVVNESGASGYTDHSATPVEVYNGGSFPVELVAGATQGGNDSKNFYMWIDKNDDGIFHKTDELVINQSSTGKVTQSLSIDRPEGTSDLRRARIIATYVILDDPCGNFSFGEAEDYTFKIVENNTMPEIKVTANVGVNSVNFVNNTNDERIKSWLWDFGDTQTSKAVAPQHSYAKSDTYTVNLTAFDQHGTELAIWSEVLVIDNETTPKISTVINGLEVNFVGANSAYPVDSNFAWDFGDGTTSTEIDPPKHIYATAGIYLVELTIDNQDFPQGKTISKSVEVTDVIYYPQFSYTINDLAVTFNNSSLVPDNLSSTNTQATLIWDFGDGSAQQRVTTNDFDEDTTHSYAQAGTYTATLTIEYTNTNGTLVTSELTSQTFTVTSGPNPIGYCNAVGDVTYEYLDSVTVNGQGPMQNANDGTLTVVNAGNPITLNAGANNSFTFVANFYGAPAYNLNYHVWIDINGDGLFGDGDWRNDKSERFVAEFEGGTNGTFTGTFALPAGINIDNTRMRVIQYWSDFKVNNVDPCSDYVANGEGGEIEDFEVSIK